VSTGSSVVEFASGVGAAEQQRIAGVLAALDLPVLRAGARVEVLAGGASNANYVLTASSSERLVLRVAKSAVERFGIDRWRGADAQRSVASVGLAPALLAAALPAGHAVSPFVDGPLLDADAIRAPGMLARVADTLRGIHAAPAIDGAFSIFADQRRYAATARDEGLRLPDDFDELMVHAAAAEAVFDAAAIRPVLCHNDLQLQNLVVQDDRIVVLDWEYAGMGNPYFDLGGVTVNAELDGAEREALLAAYFGAVRAADAARLELMLYMSALREATWAVIAEPVLELDWDYQAWAADYYDRCRRGVPGVRRALEAAR
jgi:thiamine kinase-like enzyme